MRLKNLYQLSACLYSRFTCQEKKKKERGKEKETKRIMSK